MIYAFYNRNDTGTFYAGANSIRMDDPTLHINRKRVRACVYRKHDTRERLHQIAENAFASHNASRKHAHNNWQTGEDKNSDGMTEMYA